MSSAPIIVRENRGCTGDFTWRHALAWRQLAILWKLRIQDRECADDISAVGRVGHSIAISEMAIGTKMAFADHRPTIVFLDGIRLHPQTEAYFAEEQKYYRASHTQDHVFRVERRGPLTLQVPNEVVIYGDCPGVTPIPEKGVDVLITLNGVPVIAAFNGILVVGLDPWQFGMPYAPILYPVLSNWITHELGYVHPKLEPIAALRIDDLPTTAEELASGIPAAKLDKKRARTLRSLRRFAHHEDVKFTLMYSSHFADGSGDYKGIAEVMPRSIKEIQLGVHEGVFEIGSHGMVHLRDPRAEDAASVDPREFLNLDLDGTTSHLQACEHEILELFGTKPESFVAPAWGYQPGITKKSAASHYSAIVESSQHAEGGECDVLRTVCDQDGEYFNALETFRSGTRMLSYGEPDFWRSYARCGIPVHYMQHHDRNWHLIKDACGRVLRIHGSTSRLLRFVLWIAEDPRRTRGARVAAAAFLFALAYSFDRTTRSLFWRIVKKSSLYDFAKAMKAAGYRFITVTELAAAISEFERKASDAPTFAKTAV